MGNIEDDLKFLELSLPELDSYLRSNELYWTIPGKKNDSRLSSSYRMTPGKLLLSRKRLLNWHTPLGQDILLKHLSAIISQWNAHWKIKVEKELPAKVSLLRNFLDDGKEEGFHVSSFRYHIQFRAEIELLIQESDTFSNEIKEKILDLDHLLERITISGPFIWEKELESAFPISQFWFLYRKLNSQ